MASTSRNRVGRVDARATAQSMELDLLEPNSSTSAAKHAAHGHSPAAAEDECGSTSASSSTRRQNSKVHWDDSPSKSGHRRHVLAQPKKRALARRTAPCPTLHMHASRGRGERVGFVKYVQSAAVGSRRCDPFLEGRCLSRNRSMQAFK